MLVVAHEVPLLDDGALPEGAVVTPFRAGCLACIWNVGKSIVLSNNYFDV